MNNPTNIKGKALSLALLPCIAEMYREQVITAEERNEFSRIISVGLHRNFEATFKALKMKLEQKQDSASQKDNIYYVKAINILDNYKVR